MAVTRKTVTVLFADVADSTPLGEQLDPEVLRHVMARYFETARGVLERHGGTVEKFIGDAVMAVFGVPLLHEDDAVRAVRAAGELRRELRELSRELERDRGVSIGVRIGVNTGDVVAADGRRSDHLVTGDAVNVAKRLEEAATAGEVLVGSATEQLSRACAIYDFVEPVAAKGKSDLIDAWRLVDVLGDAIRERRLDTPLVGRREQLGQLRRAFDAAVAGRSCRRVTVVGPAGIGKSRLATELCRQLEPEATVLVGRCLPYGDGITYWPIIEVIRQLGGESGLRAILARSDEADAVVAALRAISGEADGSDTYETFWAFRRVCETLARERPLLLTFEDIHWAEPTFVDLLEYLSGWMLEAPVLLLCLARSDFLDDRAGWLADGETLKLDPLSSDESAQLLDALGAAGPARVRIAEAAEGNPLYAEQMVAMVAEAGDGDLLVMPPSIHALLAARLDRLPPSERRTIERAAIVGQEFWLAAVADLGGDEERRDVGRCLLSLVRKGLIRPHRSTLLPDDAFRFAHVLIRDVAYSAITMAVRSELHERFAAWVERTVDAAELDEIVGYHLEQAYRAREQLGPLDDAARGLAERAGERIGRAGRRAFARRDLPASVSLLARAVALLPEGHPTRLAALPELGSALMRTGDFGRAEAVLNEALEGAAAAGDKRLELRTLIEREFFRTFTDPETSTDDLVAVAEAAIPLLEELGDDLGLSKAWWLLAEADVFAARWSARATALERALEHARRAGDRRDEATLISLLAQALAFGPTPVDEAIGRCEDLRRSAPDNPAVDAGVSTTIATLQAMRGQFEEARALCSRARTVFEELGLKLSRAGRSLPAGWIELLADDPAAAVRELRAGYDELEQMGERSLRPTVAAYLAYALAEAERFDEAEELAALSEELAVPADIVTQVVWRSARSRALAHSGELEEAERVGRDAVELAASTDFLELQGQTLMSLAEVLRIAGSAREAAILIESAQKTYERKGNLVAARKAREALSAGVR